MSTPSAPTIPSPSLARAFGGVWRLTYIPYFGRRRLLVWGGLAALLFLLTSQHADVNQAAYFPGWLVEFHLAFLVPVVAFLTAAGGMRDDMQSVSVDYALTRPVRRGWYALFRYASQMACLQVACGALLGAVCAAGAWGGTEGLASLVARAAAAQLLVVGAFSALGCLFGAMTGRYLVVGMLYGVIVEFGVGQIPTQLSKLSLSQHVIHAFAGAGRGLPPLAEHESLGVLAAACAVCAAIALPVAALVFSLREFAGSSAVEK